MMEVHCFTTILQPPEKVFPWIAEPEKAMQWQESVKGGEIIINKPEVIGTTFKEVIEEKGKKLVMYGAITGYQKNSMIQFHIKSQIHEFDVNYSLLRDNGNTRITIDTIIHWKFPMNIICLVMDKKIKANIQKQLESELFKLKRICEEQ